MRTLTRFCLHAAVAMVGCSVVYLLVIASVASQLPAEHETSKLLVWLIFDVPFSPVLLLGAGTVGFLINRSANDSIGPRIWIAGAIWFGLGLIGCLLDARVDYYRQSGCTATTLIWFNLLAPEPSYCGDSEGLAKLFITLPALCSAYYALGARLAIRNRIVPPIKSEEFISLDLR